jgi:threonine dehydrogenase-like Zn-dependent dehydrogenase
VTRALCLTPGVPGSARVEDVGGPPGEGGVLVEGLALGICGTDREIARGEYGEAPAGEDRLVLGHESLGRVIEAPPASGLSEGELVVGIVRRPDPVPCEACAVGAWDFCRNGRYTERGIKGLHGYGAERWRVEPEFAVGIPPVLERTGVLLEPTTIVAKAWEQVRHIERRAPVRLRSAIITGAGPIGLLAAMLAVQHGFQVTVVDIVEDGPKPDLVRALGARYHAGKITDSGVDADVVMECSGAPEVVADAIFETGPVGIVCLTGVSPEGRELELDVGGANRRIVLNNDAVFGSVNANRSHYEAAADALADADPDWLEALITRRVPLDDFADALALRPDDIKVVVDLQA